ncbi:MAG: glycosyltransferase family 4 protein [Caldilineaceae bacterium]
MRILLVSPVPPPQGGIATWTTNVINETSKRGDIALTIVDIAPRWRGIHQTDWIRRSIGGVLQLVRDFFQIWQYVRRRSTDVLHLCSSGQLALIRDILLLAFAKLYKLPTIYHLHYGRVPQLSEGKTWEWFLLCRAITLAGLVICVDKRTQATISQLLPEVQVEKLPNFVDINLSSTPSLQTGDQSIPTKPFRIAYVGWIIPSKGVLELVTAVARLSNEIEVELHLIGPQDLNYLAIIVEQGLSLGSSLSIEGELQHDQVLDSLRATDLFVLPSYTEGFPYVIVETMALGVPIVATNVGGIPEMLGIGEEDCCGVVVPPGDVAALESSIRELYFARDTRMLLGLSGRKRAKDLYSSSIVFSQLVCIWKSRGTSKY